MHFRIPTILDAGKSIMAASKMLKLLKIAVPSAENRCRHIKILKQLTLIMKDDQAQKVDTGTPQRVAKATNNKVITNNLRKKQNKNKKKMKIQIKEEQRTQSDQD